MFFPRDKFQHHYLETFPVVLIKDIQKKKSFFLALKTITGQYDKL